MDKKTLNEGMLIEHDEKNSSQSKLVSNTDEKKFLLKEINLPIINAVEFYSNILSRNGLGIFLHIDRFESYRNIAKTEIESLVNSKQDLMKLLCAFPLVFHVVGNEVALRNWIIFHLNQQEWLKELLPNSFLLLPIYISTIQFYCNELFKITPRFELPICELFSHKSKAPEAIQAVTRNIKEFKLFLQMYHEIFHLKGDKVFLSRSAVSYRSLETWIRRLLVSDITLAKHINKQETIADCTLSRMKVYEVLKNEVAVYEEVGFHYKIIFNNGSIKGLSLKKLLNKNRVVPMSSFIENIVDLEIFITSYPEVFTFINKTVFLTQLYPSITDTECTSEREDQLNCSVFNEDGMDLENNEQTIISFYLGILNNISNLPCKIPEFSINHLVYYNIIAPPEVKKISKNAKELKQFLSKYPQIFKINNDNIVLDNNKKYVSLGANEESSTSTIDSNIIKTRTFEAKLKEAVSFYTDIIYELGGTAKIEQLLDYRWQTSKEVQNIITSFEELKNFFCSQQNDFVVVHDQVCLTNKHKEGDSKFNIPINNSKLNATENAISFYSNVLRKHKCEIVSLIKVSGHRGSAPADVQTVARNPKELKTFFSQFPDVFTIVDDNKVMLSKPSEKMMSVQQQQQTFPSEMLCSDSEQNAVELFSKVLNHYGICRVLSVNKLFELKLKSSPAIQKISGCNIKQFLAFLKKYPQEFLVTNDNVIARKKIPKWSYSGKYEDKKFTDPLLLLILNFFKMYTSSKSLFYIGYLYNNVGKFFLYHDETPVFPTKSDLLLFLGLYPHIFFVDYSRIVNVIASSRKAFISTIDRTKFKNHKNQNNFRTRKPDISKPIVSNSKSPHNLSLTSLDVKKPKPSSDGIEETISNKIETNKEGAIKYVTPKQPKKGIVYRTRIRRKTKILTNVFPLVEPSISEESLVSELSKNYDEEKEAEFNSSNGLELEDHIWGNQYSPGWRNDYEGEFNPRKIEEIENNIFSHFIGKVNKNYHILKNNDLTSSDSGKIFNHSFRLTASSSFPKDFSERKNFDEFIINALMFLNGKLWEEGNLKIIKIEELFNSFSHSALEMSSCCFQSVKEFMNFLCKFPDHFIVSQNKVMARKNKMQKVSDLSNNEEESLPVILFHFFNLYTKHFNCILLKLLYSQVGRYFCNINRSPFFKSLGDLVLFLEMFPEVFCIDNNQIINLTAPQKNVYHKVKFNSGVIKINSFLDKKLYSTITSEVSPTIPESTEGWKDYVLQRTQIIEDLSQCRVVTTEILNCQKVIALDCEGVNLGAAGRLTVVQIGLANGQVYLFDIIKETSMINDGGLKDIFESESILKVIHDSRNDVANLYTEYGVKITQIFDTRVVHHLIVNQGISPKKISSKLTAIGFNELCSKYGANLNIQKDEMKNVYKNNPSYWMNRPLTKDMIAYAALDVASLVPQIFFTMLKQLKGIPEKSLWELSGKHSLSILNNKDLLFD